MTKIGIQTHGVNHSIMRKGLKTGGRIGKFGGGRTDLLEELGRVEGERSNPNRRAEISRVHGELNRGYKDGGRIGLKKGTPHSTKKGRDASKKRSFKRHYEEVRAAFPKHFKTKDFKTHGRDVPTMAAEGGRIGFKKGTDKKWIQKVNKSIKKRGTKGKCTPITKKECTGRAKALAKTFKKMAAKRKA